MASGYYLQIVASEISYDTNANTSNVNVTIRAVSPVATQYGGWNYDSTTCYVTCNGVQKSFTVASYDFRNSQTIGLGTLSFTNIQHNADGTKTIAINSSWNTDNPYVLSSGGSQTLTASSSLKLTDIPRQANITGADNFNDEQNPKISYINSAGNNVTSLQACISFTGAKDDIAYRDISKTGNSYTFNLTEAERNVLRNGTLSSNTRNVLFYVKTVLNGVTYYSKIPRTLTIVNANPVIGSITYQDTNTSVTNVTKNNQIIVQNKSSLRVSFTSPTMKKGATFTKHQFTLNGVTKESTSSSGYVDFGAINSANNLTLVSSVIDSRGNKTSNNKTISISAYSNPTMLVTLNRLNNYEDTTYLTVDGNIASVINNAMTIQYRYKLKGGTYGSYTTIQDNDKQTLTLDKNNEYIFNVVVSDSLSGSTSNEYILNKGIFPLFINTQKNSVGVNCFPKNANSFEVEGVFALNGKSLIDLIYPVGSIYISVNNVSPQTFLGGTWESFASGRTLVGVDTSQTEFNSVSKTGGAKTHTLTVAQMPQHEGHMYDNFNESGYVERNGDTNSYYLNSTGASGYGKYENRPYKVVSGNEMVMQGYTRGGGQAHNNLQPYITVYMFKRIS